MWNINTVMMYDASALCGGALVLGFGECMLMHYVLPIGWLNRCVTYSPSGS